MASGWLCASAWPWLFASPKGYKQLNTFLFVGDSGLLLLALCVNKTSPDYAKNIEAGNN